MDKETKGEFAKMSNQFAKMDKRFEKMDKRFEKIDQRFEKMDQRFEKIDQRFEKMDQRFEEMDAKWDKRLEDLAMMVAKGFQCVDQRFERVEKEMHDGFSQVNARIDGIKENTSRRDDYFVDELLTYKKRLDRVEKKVGLAPMVVRERKAVYKKIKGANQKPKRTKKI